MKQLTFLQIAKLQKTYNVKQMQEMINDGSCWRREGSTGRFAMSCLESGVCMLPLEPKVDYYGNGVPSRNMLKPATKGTFLNCNQFWARVYEGDVETIEWLEETFDSVEKEQVL
ncbi:MAG: hypothetical protein NT040_05470 [Bacteroidetes bacterium]|nr:hypothetical protein [Bacteroidota bacterium]